MNVESYLLKTVLLFIMYRNVVLKCSRNHDKGLDFKCKVNTCDSTNQIGLCDVLKHRLNVSCVLLTYNNSTTTTYGKYIDLNHSLQNFLRAYFKIS